MVRFVVFILGIAIWSGMASDKICAQDFNILEFGAIAGGRVCNQHAIQAAIDSAHAQGGGRVVIPRGRFLSGSIFLRSGVELYLAKGAVLLGSTDPADYRRLNRWKALVMADGAEDIGIGGPGLIDGQGRQLALHIDSLFHVGRLDSADYNFVERRPIHYIRPQLIEFVGCRRIRIADVTLRNAACWVQTYDQCRDLLIRRIRVESDAYWNNDGIDIQDCVNVKVIGCFVNAADDGICLKSQSGAHGCDSIYIARCTVRSSASAVKFGTVSHGGFRRVTIEDIRVYDTFRSAIAIECVDGGVLEDVLVDRVRAKNTGNAFFIRLGQRNASGPPGILRNVTIRDLRAKIAFGRPDGDYELRGPDLPFFHNPFPCSITGIPAQSVSGVTLEKIHLRFPGRGNNGLANMPLWRLDDVPENVAQYPEFSMFGELPAWGLYVRHAENFVMRQIRLRQDAPDYRPAIVIDDATGLEVRDLQVSGDEKVGQVILRKVAQARLGNARGVVRM